MSLEDDQEHFGEQIRKAMSQAMSTQPDVLVFVLRGSEIRDIMNETAQLAEDAVKEMSSSSNVTPIRRPLLPRPPGYGPPPFMDGPPAELLEEQKKRTIQGLLRYAKNCRFLAVHVEEERLFRLGTQDLAFLGLVSTSPQLFGYG